PRRKSRLPDPARLLGWTGRSPESLRSRQRSTLYSSATANCRLALGCCRHHEKPATTHRVVLLLESTSRARAVACQAFRWSLFLPHRSLPIRRPGVCETLLSKPTLILITGNVHQTVIGKEHNRQLVMTAGSAALAAAATRLNAA